MIEHLRVRPDITLAVDAEGVIRSAVSGETLADEALDRWRGLPWTDTVPSELVKEVARSIEDLRRGGESSCFTINQKFPSGREILLEYTTVNLGKKAGFIAIGKSLQATAELQSRLALVQQEREHDYWKLREIETRYRALLDASSEAVVLVRVTNLRIVEANAAATKLLGMVPGGEFYPDLPERDQSVLDAMLESVRMKGRAPGVVLHLAGDSQWSLRGSMITSEAGAFYLFQMSPLAGAAEARRAGENSRESDQFSVESFVQRMPDGFVIIDNQGLITKANHTFLDLVQAGVESAVVGQNIKRWLSRPGAGIDVVMGLVQRHGNVRAMRTTLEGELGASTEVEISAVGDQVGRPRHFGLVFRDAMSRAPVPGADPLSAVLIGRSGDSPLENIVRSSIETIERQHIVDALARNRGNRTLAAKTLRLSRQSLHAKLKKYRLGSK
jgi:transcriptional regulator PpsR